MARKKGLVWKHFTELKSGKYKQGQCRYCGIKYISNVDRMQKHLLKSCKSCPLEVKETMVMKKEKKLQRQTTPRHLAMATVGDTSGSDSDGIQSDHSEKHVGSNVASSSTSTNDVMTVTTPSISHVTPQKVLVGFIDHITDVEQAKLQQQMATAIYSSGAPLSIVENPYWVEFFHRLRPAFKTPTRHAVSKRLLCQAYDKMKTDLEEKISHSNTISIISDGWSNLRNENIINIILATPQPVFYRTIEPGN